MTVDHMNTLLEYLPSCLALSANRIPSSFRKFLLNNIYLRLFLGGGELVSKPSTLCMQPHTLCYPFVSAGSKGELIHT